MTIFKKCEYSGLDQTYTLWTDDFGVSFDMSDGAQPLYIYLVNSSGNAGYGEKVYGHKLQEDQYKYLCKEIGHTGTKAELDAINKVVADIIMNRISPKSHLERLKSTRSHEKSRSSGSLEP